MKKYVLSVLSAVFVAGCVVNDIPVTTTPVNDASVVAMARNLVANRLRDPEATRFRDGMSVYVTSAGDYVVCGTLNAKNAMGGYVGYKPFYARIRNEQLEAFILPSEDDTYGIQLNYVREGCAEAASGSITVSS